MGKLGEVAEPNHIIIRVKEKGKDTENVPFLMRFDMAKLISENKLNIFRTGGHYYLVIDKFEVGLPLSALKEIVGLALAMMPQEEVKKLVEEWVNF